MTSMLGRRSSIVAFSCPPQVFRRCQDEHSGTLIGFLPHLNLRYIRARGTRSNTSLRTLGRAHKYHIISIYGTYYLTGYARI